MALSAVAVGIALSTDPASLGLGRVDPANLPVGPPVPALEGGTGWVNTPGLTTADLAGKVVVYDFWTYSCVNCVRTMPYLRSWYDRYGADGLVIVGIHSPEFNFERSPANVEAATVRLGATWPVVLDDGMTIWDSFGNAWWPSKYVADREGRLRYRHIGEGAYEQTEDVLRSLLGVPADAPRATRPGDASKAEPGAADITAETYLGLRRGTTGAQRGRMAYPEPGPLVPGEARLVGPWDAEGERVTAVGEGAALVLRYRAREVNLVMTPPAAVRTMVEVTLDGAPLPPTYRTADTVVEPSGATVVIVDRDDMFRLALGPGVEEHTLRLSPRVPGLAAYAFTFGA